MQQVGLPGLHFHDLWGCAATLAAIAGATTAERMHRLGHATPDVPLRYQRATADRDVAVARALSDLVTSAFVVPLKTGPDRAVAIPKGRAEGTKPFRPSRRSGRPSDLR